MTISARKSVKKPARQQHRIGVIVLREAPERPCCCMPLQSGRSCQRRSVLARPQPVPPPSSAEPISSDVQRGIDLDAPTSRQSSNFLNGSLFWPDLGEGTSA